MEEHLYVRIHDVLQSPGPSYLTLPALNHLKARGCMKVLRLGFK